MNRVNIKHPIDIKPIARNYFLNFQSLLIIDWLNIPTLPHSDYFENMEDHAGEIETSAMLYFHPELVDMNKAGSGDCRDFSIEGLKNKTGWTPRDWSQISSDTGVGDPRKATGEKGKAYLEKVTDEISKLIKDLIWNDNLYTKK